MSSDRTRASSKETQAYIRICFGTKYPKQTRRLPFSRQPMGMFIIHVEYLCDEFDMPQSTQSTFNEANCVRDTPHSMGFLYHRLSLAPRPNDAKRNAGYSRDCCIDLCKVTQLRYAQTKEGIEQVIPLQRVRSFVDDCISNSLRLKTKRVVKRKTSPGLTQSLFCTSLFGGKEPLHSEISKRRQPINEFQVISMDRRTPNSTITIDEESSDLNHPGTIKSMDTIEWILELLVHCGYMSEEDKNKQLSKMSMNRRERVSDLKFILETYGNRKD